MGKEIKGKMKFRSPRVKSTADVVYPHENSCLSYLSFSKFLLMKRFSITTLAILTCVVLVAQNKKTFIADRDTVAEEQIKRLEFFLADLLEKGDIDTYSGYLTDDYVRITAAGSVSTKEQALEGFRKSKIAFQMTPHDLGVRVYGNTAILRAILDLETKTNNGTTKRSSIITKVFIRRDGKWYMASLQGTALP
jgi:ketosteroid isomerase-like protein